MGKNKLVALWIALSMLFSLMGTVAVSAVEVDSAGITQADTMLDYSMGRLKAGSYLGYGYEDKMNYSNQAELEGAGYTVAGAPAYGNIQFINNKPVLTKTIKEGSLLINGLTPEIDRNGIALPDGKHTYVQVQYSLTKTAAANAFITLGIPGMTGSGQTQIHNGTSKATGNGLAMQHGNLSSGGSEVYTAINNFYYANDIISVRSLFELGGANNNHMWIWAWNDQKGIAKGEPQVDGIFPRYGQNNTKANGFRFEMNKDTGDGQLTIHNVKVYEQAEMLFRDAVSQVEGNMLGNNPSLNLVQSDLNLKTEVNNLDLGAKATVTWSSNRTDILENDGTVHYEEFKSEQVQLTAIYTIGDKTKHIVYDIYIQDLPSDQKQLENASANLSWSTLSNQSQERVTQNFALPQSVVNDYGTVIPISWSVASGENQVRISANTAIITMNEMQAAEATIRATLTYGSNSKTIDFNFTIPQNDIISFVNMDYSQYETREITEEDGILAVSTGDGDSFVKFMKGYGLRANGNNSKNAAAIIDLAKLAEKNSLREEWRNLESDIIYEFDVNTESLSTSIVYETQVLLKNEEGKMITFLQFTGGNRSTGGANGSINLKQNDAWTNGVNVILPFINRYRAAFSNGNFPVVKIKVVYNRMDLKYDVYVKLATDADYTLFFKDALPTEKTVSEGDHAATLTITTTANSSRASAINLHNLKVYTTQENIEDYAQSYLTERVLLNGQTKNNVRGDLANYALYGTSLTWQTISSDYNGTLFDSAGKLTAKLQEGEFYQAVLKPVITYLHPKFANIKIPTDEITLKVWGYDDTSLAHGKNVSLSGASANDAFPASNINDGTHATDFRTMGDEESFSVIIDLEQKIKFSDIIIREGQNIDYNINNYTIEGSDNRRTWTVLKQGRTIGEKAEVALEEPYAEYGYIRFTVSDKIVKGKPVSIGEFMVYFDPSESYYQKLDFDSLEAVPTSVSESFYLQGLGSVYGTPISWTSSDSSILSIGSRITDESSVNYGKCRVTYSQPAYDTKVTLTAAVGSNIINKVVTAKGKNSNSSMGGSPGGGGKAPGNSNGVVSYVPPTGTQQPQTTGRYYFDLSNVAWAVDYIDGLTDLNIVSGDGSGYFYPNRNVTREEFTKMLVLSLGLAPDYQTKVFFEDLAESHWAYPYIAAAYANGIVNGISEKRFGIGSNILRQDMAVMAVRGLKAVGGVLKETEAELFIDIADVDSYAAESVNLAKANRLLSGDEQGRFLPKNSATRAESAKILYNITN